MGRPIKDISGQVFGRLTTVKFVKRIKDKTFWECICTCGKIITVRSISLQDGNTKSCGCLKALGNNRKHGHGSTKGRTPTYTSWYQMKQRCLNPNNDAYKNYGGRGIAICGKWMKFENFFKDMGERPEDKTIDRIDNEGNYEPSNCKWSTRKEQANNRRDNVNLVIDL